MRFTAFDFETASQRHNSACSIGIAVFENFVAVDTYYATICPPDRYFSPFCTRIHGITLADVIDSGDFAALWPSIEKYFDGQTVFAHYARFDMGVLKACFSHFSIEPPPFTYGCTCELSRRVFPRLANHRLDTVCGHLKISLQHHNALSDAIACGTILCEAMKISGADSVERFFADNRLTLRSVCPDNPAAAAPQSPGIEL